MKKYFNLIVALVAMLFAGNSFAFTPPPAPAQGWYVSDQTGKLTQADIASLNQKIEQVSKTTKNEFGILFLNTMDGENIEDVAYKTFNSWGIGKRGLDNGCLIVVSLQERKSRIETGKGVGGDVTDVQALNILKTNLNPFLKKGDFAGGFHSTLDALSSLIESRHNKTALVVDSTASRAVNDTPSSSAGCALAAAGVGATDSGSSGVGWFVILLLVGGLVFWRMRVAAKRRAADLQAQLDVEELRQERLKAQRVEAQRRETQRMENEERERIARERLARETVRTHVPPVSTTLGAPPAPKVVVPTAPRPAAKAAVVAAATGVTAGALAAEAERRLRDREREEAKAKAEREEESRRRRQRDEDDRRRRERDEEDRRRRQREDDDRRSSSSSDYGFGGGSSSGGGYDGGSSGGGGASSDW